MTGQSIPPSQPAPHPPVPDAKKGVPVLAWVGIGCGGLLLIVIVVAVLAVGWFKNKLREFNENPEKTAAEFFVNMHPELEKISSDDGKGEMTIRDKSGKETTVSYKDLAEGRLSVRDSEGNETTMGGSDLSRVPEWVPMPEDFSGGASAFHGETEKEASGLFYGRSGQGPDALEKFYEEAADRLDFSSRSRTSMNADGANVVTIKYSGGGKSLGVVITAKAGEDTLLNVNYQSEK